MVRFLKKLSSTICTVYLIANRLVTKYQSSFGPGDSTTNQLLYFVDEIHQAVDSTECLEIRAVFLDISQAFDMMLSLVTY